MLKTAWTKCCNLIASRRSSEPGFVVLAPKQDKKNLDGAGKQAIDEYVQGLKHDYSCNWLGALDCFLKSAKKSYPPAYLSLFLIYSSGQRGYEADDEEAEIWKQKIIKNMKWFTDRAALGDPISLHNLADIYYEGIQEQDFTKAAKYYQLAADHRFPPSQCQLGRCFQYGSGVPKNPEKSFLYYKRAADQGYPRAQYNLAWCYQYGSGTDQNYNAALKYYSLSADRGYAPAQYSLGFLYQTGKGVEQDFMIAIRYHEMAGVQGNAHAQNSLGICYEFGLGVSKDEDKAREHYQLASESGLIEAGNSVKRIKSRQEIIRSNTI